MLSYVAYHHFRSLGWVVRAGTKFGVDFLLYNRGPVFSHAEFGVMIMPSYSHKYWQTEEGKAERRIKERKDWWWLHCVNRVQSQVKKSLVLCYIEVPPPFGHENDVTDVAQLLKGYKVREFVIRRWLMNRSRG
jgi:tRNA-splicing endonuclease subunit Sen2